MKKHTIYTAKGLVIMGAHENPSQLTASLLIGVNVDGLELPIVKQYDAPEKVDRLVARIRFTQKRLWPNHAPNDDCDIGEPEYDFGKPGVN